MTSKQRAVFQEDEFQQIFGRSRRNTASTAGWTDADTSTAHVTYSSIHSSTISGMYSGQRVLTQLPRPTPLKRTISLSTLVYVTILQVFIVAATTAHVVLWSRYESPYDFAFMATWPTVFLPDTHQPGDPVTTVREASHVLNSFADRYFSLEDELNFVDVFEHVHIRDDVTKMLVPKPITMHVSFQDRRPRQTFQITADNREPLNATSQEFADLIRSASNVIMHAPVRTYSFMYERFCYEWFVAARLSIKRPVNTRVGDITTRRNYCDNASSTTSSVSKVYIVLRWMILILSIFSIISLTISTGFATAVRELNQPRRTTFLSEGSYAHVRFDEIGSSKDLGAEPPQILTFLQKCPNFQFFVAKIHWDWWSVLSLVASTMNILGCSILFTTKGIVIDQYSIRFFIGFGCLLSWVMLLQPVQKLGGEYSGFSITYQKASTAVVKVLIGVAPLYMGFVFLGVALFGSYPNSPFANADVCAKTLWAVLLGDEVLDIFQHAAHDRKYHVISRIYMYSFSFFFLNLIYRLILIQIEYRYFICVPPESEEAGDFFELADGPRQPKGEFEIETDERAELLSQIAEGSEPPMSPRISQQNEPLTPSVSRTSTVNDIANTVSNALNEFSMEFLCEFMLHLGEVDGVETYDHTHDATKCPCESPTCMICLIYQEYSNMLMSVEKQFVPLFVNK